MYFYSKAKSYCYTNGKKKSEHCRICNGHEYTNIQNQYNWSSSKAEIAGQDNPEQRIELAKDFALLNNVAEHLPDKEIRVAIEAGKSDLTEQWQVLRPVLTESQKSVKKPADQTQDKQNSNNKDCQETEVFRW